jgi:hypothetical protein
MQLNNPRSDLTWHYNRGGAFAQKQRKFHYSYINKVRINAVRFKQGMLYRENLTHMVVIGRHWSPDPPSPTYISNTRVIQQILPHEATYTATCTCSTWQRFYSNDYRIAVRSIGYNNSSDKSVPMSFTIPFGLIVICIQSKIWREIAQILTRIKQKLTRMSNCVHSQFLNEQTVIQDSVLSLKLHTLKILRFPLSQRYVTSLYTEHRERPKIVSNSIAVQKERTMRRPKAWTN